MSNKEIKTQKLKLSDLFEGNVSTRAAVKLINQKINPMAEKVILDFSKIDFISRSFTHELLRFIENGDHEIELININTAVKAMLNMVKTSKRKTPEKINPSATIRLSESASFF